MQRKIIRILNGRIFFFKYLQAYIAELGGVLVGLEYIETDD
jgi:hypothetical protein